jgi:hypothetical protein
MGLSVAVRVY